MRFVASLVIAGSFALASCSRGIVELHRAVLPDGDFYALLHRPSRMPLWDGGELFFVLNAGKKEEWSVRIFGGYDLYTDLRLSVARSGDLLFVHDERMKQTCAIDLRRRVLINREASSLEFFAVGDAHRR